MSSRNQKLCNAAVEGDVDKLNNLLARGASANYQDRDIRPTPLHHAAMKGNVQVADLLIKNKADVNATFYGATPLHHAAINGNMEITDTLIRNKANVNASTESGDTPLHMALKHDELKTAECLIRHGAKLSATNRKGKTPLHLLEDKCRNSIWYSKMEQGNSPLHQAASNDQDNVVQVLVSLGAKLSVKNERGDSPLHQVASQGKCNMVKTLASLGANLSAINDEGETPLHQAAKHGRMNTVEHLVRFGANISATNNKGDSPLHQAASYEHNNVVQVLVSLGANLSSKNDKGDSPMHQVASQGKCNMVQALASLGAKLSAINNEGDTPLHQAARHGKLNTVEHLVRLGANISATNYKGSSPLHQAASYGKESTVETLVRLGADLSARNVEGKTPYELAEDGYVRNKNNRHAYTFQKIVDFLKENAEILGNSRENSSVASKILEINSDTSELPKGIQSDKTKENDIQLPWLVDAEEFKRMLSHGEYLSYDNLLSLGGPCRAGKSTLASVLIGEEIPLKWNSTEWLVIYFGRNGINIEKKEMIPLEKGERGHEVFSKILRGKPNFRKMSENDTKGQTSTLNKSGQSVRRNVLASALPAKHTEEVKNNTKFSRGKKTSFSKTKSCPELLKPQILNADKPTVTTVIQSLEFQELQLQSGILEEVRNGEYKIGLAPSDLIDFGGQKSYDMTHQLFIQHRGSFLLMFDGRFGLHNQLLEYPEGVTAADILKHWVDSVLTYIEDTEDIMPMIMFAATHRDQCKVREIMNVNSKLHEVKHVAFQQANTIEMKDRFIKDIKTMFHGYEKKDHLHLDTVYFINGIDKNDAEIKSMTDQVVLFAMKQNSWGQRRPMQWVPLELQISKMRMKNVNIISKEDLLHVNMLNRDLALDEHQLNAFLLVQHSLGKLMYYDLDGLNQFIIIHPPALVNILRSFVTDEKFFPANPSLKAILQNMTDTGKIYKQDLLQLWQQDHFHQYMQDDSIKDFVIQLLIYLDILIIPKASKQISHVYLVPCMIKAPRPSSFNVADNQGVNTICLRYTLARSSIPTSLAYKIIGASISAWPLKVEDKKPCLYHKAALFNVSEDNELRIWLKDNRVLVNLTNSDSLLSLSPDIAASVQECLTNNIESCLLFHYNSFGRKLKRTQISDLYTMEIGTSCENSVCFTSPEHVMMNERWTCGNGKVHETRYLRFWLFNKSQQKCGPECKGLNDNELKTAPSDKHLVRLGCQIGIRAFDNFFIQLGMDRKALDTIEYTYASHSPGDIMSMALIQWKNSKIIELEDPTLKELADALHATEMDSHLICQVFREKAKLLEIADLNLQVIPSDQHLKILSNHIGNCPFQLGIELGLSYKDVKQSLFSFPRNLPGLVESILAKWKKNLKVTTIHSLIMALGRVDAGGFKCLLDTSKCPCSYLQK